MIEIDNAYKCWANARDSVFLPQMPNVPFPMLAASTGLAMTVQPVSPWPGATVSTS